MKDSIFKALKLNDLSAIRLYIANITKDLTQSDDIKYTPKLKNLRESLLFASF